MEELKEFLIGFEQRNNERFQKMENNFDRKLNEFKTGIENNFYQKMDELRKELLDKQFLFEEEYGTKIDAILDAVTLELDKNLEKSDKIRKLDNRMDRAEANIFGHEKRISRLEMKK